MKAAWISRLLLLLLPLLFGTRGAAEAAAAAAASASDSSNHQQELTFSCGPEEEDRIYELPGLPQIEPSTAWYSGYLEYNLKGRRVYTHYVLVGAELDDQEEKPLIYWSS